jgi:heavy metal sensor kinase
MKFFQSIRWQLQVWHGLLLGIVLAGFGFTGLQFLRDNQLRRIGQELEQRISPIADAMRREGWDPDHPPQSRPESPPEFDLHLFDGNPGSAFYFVVWLPDGREIARSASAPADVPCPERISRPRDLRLRGKFLEFFHFKSPDACCILVGRDVNGELAGVRHYAWLFFGAGGTVFLLGLAGGWWISNQTLRPIANISSTAAKIAGGDLSKRIPTGGPGSELGDLVGVLNETFSRLQASFARQAQFTADASHELRTPVSVVLTQTQTALARERPAAEYRESLEACQRAALRMRRLTESLLTLARLDSGDTAITYRPCAFDRVTTEAVELLRPFASEKHVTLSLDLAPVTCEGNAEQFGQIVTNLVSNAISYNRPGGSVHVRVASEANETVLSVCDTGQGIAPEDLPHIFERFYRSDKARPGSTGNIGLGLSIAKALVEAHQGTLQAKSELGKGSTFTARWPLTGRSP